MAEDSPMRPSPASNREEGGEKPARGRTAGQQRRTQRSVFQYIAVLFAAAFVLLLFSYMMERRAYEQHESENQQQLDQLQQSSLSATQRLESILAERDRLKEENQQLQQQLDQAGQERGQLEQQAEDQQRALQAMDWFWRIQRQYSRGYHRAARELAEAFEASGLPAWLPDEAYADPDGPTPAQQYQELRDLLRYQAARFT